MGDIFVRHCTNYGVDVCKMACSFQLILAITAMASISHSHPHFLLQPLPIESATPPHPTAPSSLWAECMILGEASLQVHFMSQNLSLRYVKTLLKLLAALQGHEKVKRTQMNDGGDAWNS